MSACLLWALPPGLGFYTRERSPPDHRAMIEGSPCGGLTATARTSADHRPKIVLCYTPLDRRAIIGRGSRGGWTEIGRFTALFSHENFRRWPTDRRQMIRRRPVGRRQMSELPQASGGHPANFNCELNLPDGCQTSAGWGLYRRITAGFLPDLTKWWPRGDPGDGFYALVTGP